MEPSAEIAAAASATERDDPARRPLIALASLTFVATVTGTFVFAYPETLRALTVAMVLIHDLSGDLMIVSGAVYLWVHLGRTWRMWRMVLSRWTGYLAVASFAAAAVSGVLGQLTEMPEGSVIWIVHVVSTIALLVIGCGHGAYGLRRYFR